MQQQGSKHFAPRLPPILTLGRQAFDYDLFDA